MSEAIERVKKLMPQFKKNYVKVKFLNQLKEIVDNIDDIDSADKIFDILDDKKKLTVDEKKDIIINCKKLINELEKQHDDESDDSSESDSSDDESELTEDQRQFLKKIEIILDSKILYYGRYNKNNPMLGITWSEDNKKWRLQYDHNNKKINKYSSDLKILCNEIVEKKFAKYQNSNLINSINFFVYKKKYILIYESLLKPLFDIRHIINLLDIDYDAMRKKYKKYNKYIVKSSLTKNEYGGFVLREFIPEKIVFDIILSSNSKFSKNFKSEVSQILVDLRKNGKLIISDGELKYDASFDNINQSIKSKHYIYKYTNNEDITKIIHTMMNKEIIITKYYKQHLLYAFLIPYKNKYGYVIIKFGYTYDIIDRIKSLKKEFKCDRIYLLGLKIIKAEAREKKFHAMLKTMYPELCFPITINGKNKEEEYCLSEILLKEFFKVKEYKCAEEKMSSSDIEEYKKLQQNINSRGDTYAKHIIELVKFEDSELMSILNKVSEPDIIRDIVINYQTQQTKIILMDKEIELLQKKKETEIAIIKEKQKLIDKELELEKLKYENNS